MYHIKFVDVMATDPNDPTELVSNYGKCIK